MHLHHGVECEFYTSEVVFSTSFLAVNYFTVGGLQHLTIRSPITYITMSY